MGAAASSRAAAAPEFDVWAGASEEEVERRLADEDGAAVCADTVDPGDLAGDATAGLFVTAPSDGDCLRLGSHVPRIVALRLTEAVGSAVNAGDASPSPTSLRRLTLAGLDWRTPSWLAGCPRLRALDVSGCAGLDLAALAGALAAPAALRSLTAEACGLGAAALEGLRPCGQLEVLRLARNAFGAADLRAAAAALEGFGETLADLDLRGSPLAALAAYPDAALDALPRLAILDGEPVAAAAPSPCCSP